MPKGTVSVLAGRYELGPLIGRGGMADVHAGRDLELDRPVAIKLLVAPYDRDRDFVRRFRHEARAAARLNHPNVVAVYDTGSDGDRHFIVTELVSGETLASVLAREGPLAPARALEIAIQVCRALAAAHVGGVVHRDVKPGNVMVIGAGGVKVVDFGIARAAGFEALTRSGLVIGSAPYLSPEQARGEPGEPRSDLYGLGCLLYEMVTGRPPFAGETALATLFLHVYGTPPPPSEVAPVPRALEAIVLRCLEKDPSRRYESAQALEAALQGVGDGSAAVAPRPADGSTEPLATAPVPAPDEPTTPVERPDVETLDDVPRHRRSREPRPSLVLAGFVVVLALAVWGLSRLVDTPGEGPERTATRPLDGPAADTGVTGSTGELTGAVGRGAGDDVPDEEAAFGALSEAIERTSASADPDAVSKLRDGAMKLFEKYREGKLDDVGKEAEKILEELAKLEEEGRIGEDEAMAVGAATDELLQVIGVRLGEEDDDDDEGDD